MYGTFWLAAQIQAYIFILTAGIIAIAAITVLAVVVYNINFDELVSSDEENPGAVPTSHGTESTAHGEIKSIALKDINTDEDEKRCSVCKENEKTHACIPCGHMCLCALCAEDLSKRALQKQTNAKCPLCRLDVDKFIRIYQ